MKTFKKITKFLLVFSLIFVNFAYFIRENTEAMAPTITVNSYSVNSSRTEIAITYTVHNDWSYPTSWNVSYDIGYEVPAEYYWIGSRTVPINKKKGTYTARIPYESSIVATVKIFTRYTAFQGEITDVVNRGSLFVAPNGTSELVKELTAIDVVGGFVILASGVALAGTLASLKVTFAPPVAGSFILAGVVSFAYEINSSFNLGVLRPTPAIGQVYLIENFYSNENLCTRIKIWTNRASYNARNGSPSVPPIFNRTYCKGLPK